MKINHNIRRFVACLTMAVATSASFFTEAQAGVEMKCVSLEKASYGDTTRTTIKYAPTFSYNGGVTISSAVSPELALTLGRAKINGEVILQDDVPPMVSYSIKFNAATADSAMGNVEKYRNILRSAKVSTRYAELILKQHERCHITDAGMNSAIALLALEPSIVVKDAGIQQRLDSTRTALLKAMEARALFTELVTGSIKRVAEDHAFFQDEYDRLVAEGEEARYALYGAMYATNPSDPVKSALDAVQYRYDKLGMSVNVQQLLTDFYGEPVSYCNLLLSKLDDSELPDYDVKGSIDQLDDYVFSITQADALDLKLEELKVDPAAKLDKAVREYEAAVKEALIDMCRTEIREENDKKKEIKTETDTVTGETKPIVISCDFGSDTKDNTAEKSDKSVPKNVTKNSQNSGKSTVSDSATLPLPQLLPFSKDFKQLLMDTSYNELEKLAEILSYVQDAESAAAVTQGGENSLLNRWLAQYIAKVEQIAEDKDKGDNFDIICEYAMFLASDKEFNYPGKMMSLRNDKFVPALDCIYGNDCFGNKELHRQLLNINNKTNIFVNGKMKPIYTIRDYVENVKLK